MILIRFLIQIFLRPLTFKAIKHDLCVPQTYSFLS